MPDAKTCELKSLRKESDKAKIILLSLFHLVRDLIQLCTPGKERVFLEGKRCDRWSAEHRIVPNRWGNSVKVGQRTGAAERER
jgi:hypothetical protein